MESTQATGPTEGHTTPKLSDQIRQAIVASGWTPYRISFAARLPEQAVREFLQGKRDIRLKSLDKIVAACFPIGLTLMYQLQNHA